MKLKLVFLIFLAIALITPNIFALNGADVAIYTGSGTWDDGIAAFEKFLDSQRITWEEIGSWDVNNKDLRPLYKAIYMPGGYAASYKIAIKSSGNQHIRDLVNSGGAYIGICAGAYYAADKVDWEGRVYDYPLKLFKGRAYGAIDEIIPWKGYTMTKININQQNPINIGQPASYEMLYYGGPAFFPDGSQQIENLATYQNYNNEKAVINYEYGNGRVLLIGPHPEIEENSDRDGSTFGSELYDPDTDWSFLESSVKWVLKMAPPTPDIIAPVINFVSDNPDPLNSGQLLKIEADVTDNVKVDSVSVNIFGTDYQMNLNQGSVTEIFFDGFESGLSGWTTTAVSGANKWTASTLNPCQGSYHARSQPMSTNEPASMLEMAISTTGYENIKLSYYRKLVGLDIGDEFKAKWYDGSTWVILEQTGSNSVNDANYVLKEFSLPTSASNNLNFKIKFECTAGAVSEYCQVDNVKITANIQGTGLYEYFYDTTSLTFGDYTYTINANDRTGNQAFSAGTFTII